MKKLLNLLNEYGKTSNCGPFEDYRIEPATDYNSSYLVLQRDDNGEGDWKDWHLDIPRLISKDYGFIDWLVKNDKVDLEKLDTPEYIDLGDDFMKLNDSNYLIMILSIQDNPLKYICSILK